MLDHIFIYDDCSSSLSSTTPSETDVERGVEITVEQLHKKRDWLLTLCGRKKLEKSRISGAVLSEKFRSEAHTEICLYTTDSASMNISLRKYANGKCFIGLRGSPTKLISGQNLLNTVVSKTLDNIKTRLKCSDFEAQSVYGFRLLAHCVKRELGVTEFYTDEEDNALDTLNISVYSITFASYRHFGRTEKERNDNLDFMAYLSSYGINVEKRSFQLSDFLGIRMKKWSVTDSDHEGWSGLNTGVLFQKVRPNGSVMCKQMYYLKHQEMEAKSTSGRRNVEALEERMTESQRAAVLTTHVRLDSTFSKEYIKEWLYALTKKKVPAGEDVTIQTAAPLFDNQEYVQAMTLMVTNEMGLRTLMLSPLVHDIEKIVTDSTLWKPKELEILSTWLEIDASVEDDPKKGKRLKWRNICDSDMAAWRLNEKLMEDHYIDIRMPLDFYIHLTKARQDHVTLMRESKALSADHVNYSGKGSRKELLPAIKAGSILVEARKAIEALRLMVNLPTHKSKQRIVSRFMEQANKGYTNTIGDKKC